MVSAIGASAFHQIDMPLDAKEQLQAFTVRNRPSVGAGGYFYGECVWGVATWIGVPQNLGNAQDWAVNAAAQGFEVTQTPLVGAVAVSTKGPYGHVALVVGLDGSNVEVQEMNVYGHGVIDRNWYPVSYFDAYIYFQ